MATIEEGLYAALVGDGYIGGLVSTRVYPMVAPQEAALPLVVYQRVSGPRHQHHDGPAGLAEARIQLTITAETYSSAKSVASGIRDVLVGFRGVLGGKVDVHEARIENEVDGYGLAIEAPTVRLDVWCLYSE